MKIVENNEYRDVAVEIAKVLDGKKPEEILLLNVSTLSNLTDWFVLATGLNGIHIKSLADEVEEKLQKKGIKLYRKEGVGDWIVLDFHYVIVHLFTAELRSYYHLEKLWNDGKNTYTLPSIEKIMDKEKKQAELKEKKTLEKEKKEAEIKEKQTLKNEQKTAKTKTEKTKVVKK